MQASDVVAKIVVGFRVLLHPWLETVRERFEPDADVTAISG
jgi:hypothetical protein